MNPKTPIDPPKSLRMALKRRWWRKLCEKLVIMKMNIYPGPCVKYQTPNNRPKAAANPFVKQGSTEPKTNGGQHIRPPVRLITFSTVPSFPSHFSWLKSRRSVSSHHVIHRAGQFPPHTQRRAVHRSVPSSGDLTIFLPFLCVFQRSSWLAAGWRERERQSQV